MVRIQPADGAQCGRVPWRVGRIRSVDRALYDADENLIGLMDAEGLAALVVAAVNAWAQP